MELSENMIFLVIFGEQHWQDMQSNNYLKHDNYKHLHVLHLFFYCIHYIYILD